MDKANNAFKQLIADYLGCAPGNITLFFKGRIALYAILKALGIGPNDEVILPAFTCVAAVNPVIYAGAKPVYVDIDPGTYTIDVNKIESYITNNTRAILAQNTFGLSPDLDGIKQIAKKHNLFVIEDCAQGFGGGYKGAKNGITTDASFFSTQWNKVFSTGLGGIAVAMDANIAEKLTAVEKTAIRPFLQDVFMLKVFMAVNDVFNKPRTYWPAMNVYRWLSKYNVIPGSSQGFELISAKMPRGFLKSFSGVQAKKGMENLFDIGKIISHRRKIAYLYRGILTRLGMEPPLEPPYATHIYLRFPILVKNKEEFFKKAVKDKVEIGDWFLSPIHPVVKNFQLWNYRYGENPIAEKICQHIVNLPTHLKIDVPYTDKIYDFLCKNKKALIASNKGLF